MPARRGKAAARTKSATRKKTAAPDRAGSQRTVSNLEQLPDDRFVFGRPSAVSELGLRRTAKQMAAVRALHVDPRPWPSVGEGLRAG